jgi:hypothetical protein
MTRPTIQSVVARFDLTPNRAGFICCPVHEEASPSCQLHDDWWYCFGCGANGDAIGLIAALSKRPIGDVLREYAEHTDTWRRTSRHTQTLDPFTYTRNLRTAWHRLNAWFFTALAAALSGAPDWLMLRTVEYWNDVFDEHRVDFDRMIEEKRRVDAEALLKAMHAQLERGLGIETGYWEKMEEGLWLLRATGKAEA